MKILGVGTFFVYDRDLFHFFGVEGKKVKKSGKNLCDRGLIECPHFRLWEFKVACMLLKKPVFEARLLMRKASAAALETCLIGLRLGTALVVLSMFFIIISGRSFCGCCHSILMILMLALRLQQKAFVLLYSSV